MKTKNRISQIKKTLLKRPKEEAGCTVPRNSLLSSGSTLLNLGCSGSPFGAFPKGKIILVVGDSSSGKTALSLTCLAEACMSEWFEDYTLVHDDVEGGQLFNIKMLFGNKLATKLKTEHSSTLEEMYYNIEKYIEKKKPFIYVIDSMDSLITEDDEDKFQQQRKASANNKQVAGSYGTSKAKMNSANLRRLVTPLRDSGSILVIISQTRDNLGFGFNKKVRSGGHALRFYATVEIWSSVVEKLKKSFKGKQRQIGIISKVAIKKNRLTGRDREVLIPIYHTFGIDDLGSCIEYLIDESHWKKTGKNINAPEFDYKGTIDGLIAKIETEKSQRQLQRLVGKVWNDIENHLKIPRVKKYE